MNKETKYIILIVSIAIVSIIALFFFINLYSVHKANEKADQIVVGDNEDLGETDKDNIDKAIINKADVIGKLTIPDILLSDAPIKEGTELTILSDAIGHFTSTSIYSGNVGLASHNSGGKGEYFKNLRNIKKGSEIFYETQYGVKRYVVEVKEIIDETDFSYLQATEDNRITLITCVAGQRNKRLCVQAVENYENMMYGQ